MILASLLLWQCSGLLVSPVFAKEVDGVVAMDVSRAAHSDLTKRDGSDSVPVDLDNRKAFYQVTVAVGTPQQSLQLVVDTGSSDTWVTSDQFNTGDSSSFAKNESAKDFSIGYGDNSQATGYWGTDVIQVGTGATVKDVSFGVANTTSAQPILGIGLTQGESTVTAVTTDGELEPTYDNLPVLLKAQGFIKRVAYSLWLNDKNAGKGQLLMGGIDHEKYQGSQLGLVPVVNDNSVPAAKNPTTLSVMLHGIATNDTEFTTSIPVLLDSGSTMSYLPKDLISTLASNLGASPLGDYFSLPCDAQGTLTFDLSGLMLPVSLQDVLMSVHAGSQQYCVLSFVEHTASQRFILGDNVLRNWYVVYDLEGLQIGIAPALLNREDSNVQAIDQSIPGMAAPSYSSTNVQESVGSTAFSRSETTLASSSTSSQVPTSQSSTSQTSTSQTTSSQASTSMTMPSSQTSSQAASSSIPSSSSSSSSSSSASSSATPSTSTTPTSSMASGSSIGASLGASTIFPASSRMSSVVLASSSSASSSVSELSSSLLPPVSNLTNSVKSSVSPTSSKNIVTSVSFRNSSTVMATPHTSTSVSTSVSPVNSKNNAAIIGASRLAFLAWCLLF